MVSEIKVNLFSSGTCLDKGIQMILDNKVCKFIKNDSSVCSSGYIRNNTIVINLKLYRHRKIHKLM